MMNKKTYFLSDAHLGSRALENPARNERRLCSFLDSIKEDAETVYLLGDMLDFWFEYHNVVPKGTVRFLGKLAELTDAGIAVHYFTGNHDVWTFGYLERECGVIVHRVPLVLSLTKGNGIPYRMYLAHGDGLNESGSFKYIRYLFHSRFCQWLFRNLVPADLGMEIGLRWARRSRLSHSSPKTVTNEFGDFMASNIGGEEPFKGEDSEELVLYAKDYLRKDSTIDCFVFGHRHIELDLMLAKDKRLIILGEWMNLCTYAVWDGEGISLAGIID